MNCEPLKWKFRPNLIWMHTCSSYIGLAKPGGYVNICASAWAGVGKMDFSSQDLKKKNHTLSYVTKYSLNSNHCKAPKTITVKYYMHTQAFCSLWKPESQAKQNNFIEYTLNLHAKNYQALDKQNCFHPSLWSIFLTKKMKAFIRLIDCLGEQVARLAPGKLGIWDEHLSVRKPVST